MNNEQKVEELQRLKEEYENKNGHTAFIELAEELDVFEGEFNDQLSEESIDLLIKEIKKRLEKEDS